MEKPKRGYRLVVGLGNKVYSLADWSREVSLKKGRRSYPEGLRLGARRDLFDYIDNDEGVRQFLLTYEFGDDDFNKKPDFDGEFSVKAAELVDVEEVHPGLNENLEDVYGVDENELAICRHMFEDMSVYEAYQHGEIHPLLEKLTFSQLYDISEPKRKVRAETVRGPSLQMSAGEDTETYYFNFKSFPSTTGLRHKGYIRFFKPRGMISPDDYRPMENLDCFVDCTCPDYRYRWAWANKQRGSSAVGPGSLNLCLNRAPRKTNPTGTPGLCKHLLHLSDYVYGTTTTFGGSGADDSPVMRRIVKYADKRWTDLDSELQRAKEREQAYSKRATRYAVGDVPRPDGEVHIPARPDDIEVPDPPTLDDPDDLGSEVVTAPDVPEDPEDARPTGFLNQVLNAARRGAETIGSSVRNWTNRFSRPFRRGTDSTEETLQSRRVCITGTKTAMSIKQSIKTIRSLRENEELVDELPDAPAAPSEEGEVEGQGEKAIDILTQILNQLQELVQVEKGEGEEIEDVEDDLEDLEDNIEGDLEGIADEGDGEDFNPEK